MELINYEETLQQLKKFNDLDLGNLLNLEMNLKDAETTDLISLYEVLEQTKQNLLKMKELIYSI